MVPKAIFLWSLPTLLTLSFYNLHDTNPLTPFQTLQPEGEEKMTVTNGLRET